MSLMTGYLTKSPPKSIEDFIHIKRWKRRYFELKKHDGKLYLEYRKSKTSKTLKGLIDLSHIKYLVNNFPFIRQRRNLFAIKVSDNNRTRIFYFNAKSINEYDAWLRSLISFMDLIQTTMDLTRAKELMLAGFFDKSYIKDQQGFCEMFVNSLHIYIPKITESPVQLPSQASNKHENKDNNKNVPKHRHECRKYSDDSFFNDELCLPTRCTSTLSSDSSSESDSDDDSDTQDVIQQMSNSITKRYIDSNNLEFDPVVKVKPINKNLATSDQITYCVIDPSHTEALYKLNKRLGSL